MAHSISIFNINIAVYSLADNENVYEFLKYYDNDISNNKENFLIILCYDDKIKHYQLLTYNKEEETKKKMKLIIKY